jgi:hypothetical protein
MSGAFGVLGVIFVLVPGYIADLAFRACWGASKGDEFDRSLRSIIWSVLGFILYVGAWGKAPRFADLFVIRPTLESFDWKVTSSWAVDVVFCTGGALLVGWIANAKWAQKRFAKWFKRSLTFETPWESAWAREGQMRHIRVVMKDGPVYVGRGYSMSQDMEQKELLLADPSEEKDGAFTPVAGIRFMYIRVDETREIHFSYTEEEAKRVQGQQVGKQLSESAAGTAKN